MNVNSWPDVALLDRQLRKTNHATMVVVKMKGKTARVTLPARGVSVLSFGRTRVFRLFYRCPASSGIATSVAPALQRAAFERRLVRGKRVGDQVDISIPVCSGNGAVEKRQQQ